MAPVTVSAMAKGSYVRMYEIMYVCHPVAVLVMPAGRQMANHVITPALADGSKEVTTTVYTK